MPGHEKATALERQLKVSENFHVPLKRFAVGLVVLQYAITNIVLTVIGLENCNVLG